MQATFVQEGRSIDYTPVGAVAVGTVVVVGSIVAVAHRALAAGVAGSLAVEGIFDVAKANVEIAGGAALYWDADGDPVGGTAGSGAATTTAAGNKYMGLASPDGAAAGDATVCTRLGGAASVTAQVVNGLSTVIADPGNAGAIPVAADGHVDIVTAAAETRTLAAPTNVGQMLLIGMKTDGGDCVITCATTVNQTGNNTITLNDAGDAVLLVAKANGANKRWSVVSNDGAALTTV